MTSCQFLISLYSIFEHEPGSFQSWQTFIRTCLPGILCNCQRRETKVLHTGFKVLMYCIFTPQSNESLCTWGYMTDTTSEKKEIDGACVRKTLFPIDHSDMFQWASGLQFKKIWCHLNYDWCVQHLPDRNCIPEQINLANFIAVIFELDPSVWMGIKWHPQLEEPGFCWMCIKGRMKEEFRHERQKMTSDLSGTQTMNAPRTDFGWWYRRFLFVLICIPHQLHLHYCSNRKYCSSLIK